MPVQSDESDEDLQPLLPHQALAFMLAQHTRLGTRAEARVLGGNADVLRLILRDLFLTPLTVMFTAYRCCIETIWRPISPCKRLPLMPVMHPVHMPCFKWLGNALEINMKSSGQRHTTMLEQWKSFLCITLQGLWYEYTVLFPHHTRAPEYQVLLFDSDPARSVFGNDASYIEGLLSGFFMPWMMTKSASGSIMFNHGHHANRDNTRRPFVVRRNGERLQVFIFGCDVSEVMRHVLLNSTTLKGPAERRVLLQHGIGGQGGWHVIRSAEVFNRRRRRMPFSDARRIAASLDCILE